MDVFSPTPQPCRPRLLLIFVAVWFAGCATGHSRATADKPAVNRPDSPDNVEPVEPETLGPAVSVQTASSSEMTDADFSVRQTQMEYFLNQGPSYALRHIETEPVIENEKFEGYRITAITSAAKRHTENNLKKGDIVTQINGERLDEPKSYMVVWKSLPDRSKIKLEVRRDGNLRQITGVVR